MKKFIYFLIVVLFAFVSCEKENLDTEATDPSMELAEVDFHGHKKFVTVVGQNNPAEDIGAVQNAVDHHKYVKLSGTFDFGTDELDGGVDINQADVILKGPATIVNGAKTEEIPALGFVKYPISIRKPGVILSDLEISGDHDGILVYAEAQGRPVVIYKNNIVAGTAAIAITATPGGIKVFNNEMEAFLNYYGIETTGDTQIINNDMKSGYDCVFLFGFDHRLDVLHNRMNVNNGYEGMFIGAWQVTSETGPDYGHNPPVRIIGNKIDIGGPDAGGIIVGTSAHGINNTMVRNNTITGNGGFGGLIKEPYGYNNKFINNDLSGLTTYAPQILLMGSRDNHFINNKLGRVEPVPGGVFIPEFRNSATLVSTINWHEFDGLDTPDPLNHGNRFIQNDYKQTGVPGWTDDPDSYGAVLLLDFILKFDETGNLVLDPYVMENFVNEKRFPAGTDVCDQVLDLNPGSNHIVGSQGCESSAKKASVDQLSKQFRSFSEAVNHRNQRREEAFNKAWNKR